MLPPNRRPSPDRVRGNFQKPGVVFQPQVYNALQAGMNLIVEAVRPTLGPLPRLVGVEHVLPGKQPELLDSGAVIARRIQQVTGRDRDMGAMFARHVLWALQERVGDGTTSAALMMQSVFNQGVGYVSAGGNAQRLRHALEKKQKLILAQLDEMAWRIEGRETLSEIAKNVCHDVELSQELGLAFAILGPYGRLEIRSGRGREITHEFVQGIYWDEGVLHPEMLSDKLNARTLVFDPAIVVSDLEIRDVEDTIHLLEVAHEAEIGAVLLVCRSIEPQALAPLLNPNNRERVNIIAVRLPGNFPEVQYHHLQDLSVLTGARPILAASGASLRTIRLPDFGQARRAWAYRDTFGITTGKGDPLRVREHFEELRRAYCNGPAPEKRDDLEKRLGRLHGGAVTLWVGALTEDAYQARKANAERSARAIRTCLIGGVIPGAGCGLLACRNKLLQEARHTTDGEEPTATRILANALEVPFRVLCRNAGLDSGQIELQLDRFRPGSAYDVLRKKWVDARQNGLVDSLLVVKEAVRSAISSASLLLTTDVLVHLKNPPELYQP